MKMNIYFISAEKKWLSATLITVKNENLLCAKLRKSPALYRQIHIFL